MLPLTEKVKVTDLRKESKSYAEVAKVRTKNIHRIWYFCGFGLPPRA